jgi:hypothetical protein
LEATSFSPELFFSIIQIQKWLITRRMQGTKETGELRIASGKSAVQMWQRIRLMENITGQGEDKQVTM